MSHKNIVITGGSLQSDSQGIAALVLGTIISIKSANPDVSFTVIEFGRYNPNPIPDMEIGKSVTEYKIRVRQFPVLLIKAILSAVLSKRSWRYTINYDPIMTAFVEADAIVNLSAGDSFSDIYGYKSFLSYFLFGMIAIILKRPLIFFPQTIGPFDKYLGRSLARFSLRKAKLVFTREIFSTDLVRKLCGNSVSVIEKVDMAFLMQPAENNNPKLARIRPRVGLNISGFMCFSKKAKTLFRDFEYIGFMKEIVKLFVKNYNADLLLVPHDYALDDNDLKACEILYASLDDSYRERVTIMREIHNAPRLKAIIGDCDFFIGARLHACIAALSMRVPTVPIAYSYKFLGILHKIGLSESEVCDPRKESPDIMIAKIQRSYENRASTRHHLEEKIPEIQAVALSCGKMLDDLMSK